MAHCCQLLLAAVLIWDVVIGSAATAGVDHQVLLWNPSVTSEPVCALGGHASPVLAVRFMQTKQQLLSYSKDKVGVCVPECSALQRNDNAMMKSPPPPLKY